MATKATPGSPSRSGGDEVHKKRGKPKEGKKKAEKEESSGGSDEVQNLLIDKIAQLSAQAAPSEEEARANSEELQRLVKVWRKDALKDWRKGISAAANANANNQPGESEETTTSNGGACKSEGEAALAAGQTLFVREYIEAQKCQRDKEALRKRMDSVLREKEQLAGELNKCNTMRAKLEHLCRELQRKNKDIIEESRRSAVEQENIRAELQEKFQETIKDIQVKIDEQAEDRLRQHEESKALQEKLRDIVGQYDLREKQYEKELKKKDLEHKLASAKLEQEKEISKAERERAEAFKERALALEASENELRAQLGLYGEKFDLFQSTLQQSNDSFTMFKKEMHSMEKKIIELTKENSSLKRKCKESDAAIITMHQESSLLRKESTTLRTRNKTLENLCRVLRGSANTATEDAPVPSAPPSEADSLSTPASAYTSSKGYEECVSRVDGPSGEVDTRVRGETEAQDSAVEKLGSVQQDASPQDGNSVSTSASASVVREAASERDSEPTGGVGVEEPQGGSEGDKKKRQRRKKKNNPATQ